MRTLERCNLCGSQSLTTLYSKVFDNRSPWSEFILPEDFPITVRGVLCRSCGWVFQNPAYDEGELDRLYSPQGEEPSAEAKALATQNAGIRGRRIFTTLEPWLRANKGRVLDVGGRNGELMGTFVQHGYQVSVLDMDGGVPVSPEITKIRSPFLSWEKEQFDIIIMSHVLEHTDNPLSFLLHAKKLLVESGLLFVEVPFELLTPLLLRHVGDHRHLGYFSKTTLRAFLEKSGFTCLHCAPLVDVVGAPIPIIRVAARNSNSDGYVRWTPPRFMAIESLAAMFNHVLWMSRVRNRVVNHFFLRGP